ncbi:hypothetical protein [Oceanobacillus neutriphilus]|uniref:Uncharacterized protein n=1 Tax=Oceanobacillus neutriphilus TaxID=531815 RepID=A0ABQ2P269_9BACI|nr:hypothetical protein [Oceanobacillus neutriphilus]GGP16406.1 hypothetical protein GCM10011346_48330 [Oceanobacillus neutriphilus]
MKFTKVFIFFTILSFLLFPISGVASALEKLPSSDKTDQWEIMIDKPKNEDVEPKPDVYNMYSMDVQYIGDEDIKLERIEAYRDDPSSSYDFELFTIADTDDFEIDKNSKQPVFNHQNFPLSVQAKELKVIVTWTNKGDSDRKYREEFIFKQ